MFNLKVKLNQMLKMYKKTMIKIKVKIRKMLMMRMKKKNKMLKNSMKFMREMKSTSRLH
jgi:hypothetical protein